MALHAENFRNDLRVKQAQGLLYEAMREHTRHLTTIVPPDPKRKVHYQELLENFGKTRGAPLFYPYLGSGLGNGALVELLDGSVKYDLITGIGVHFFGHSHPLLVESAFNAALSNTIMQGNLQQNEDSVELCSLLSKISRMPHCFLTTSGVMANENALKVAFQKNGSAHRILAFDHCFAGRSLTFSQVTDKPAFREGLPLNQPVDYIPFYDVNKPEESTHFAVETLKKQIQRYPKEHALMHFELVQGEGGFYPGSNSFFEKLMAICKEHHIAIWVDEVQTFGRTSHLLAYDHFGLQKYVDILTIGKMTQVCATLFTKEFCPKPGLLSQTFTGATSSIQASRTILEALQASNLYGETGRNLKIHQRFTDHLQKLENSGLVHGPYGIGAMIAFTPFDGRYEKTKKLAEALFEAGVITFIAGTHPTRIRLLPPAAVITDAQIDQAMEIIGSTLSTLRL